VSFRLTMGNTHRKVIDRASSMKKTVKPKANVGRLFPEERANDLLWALGKPVDNQLTGVDYLTVRQDHRIRLSQIQPRLEMLSKILYSDLRFSGALDCCVMVTMVHEEKQYIVAGHGNHNLAAVIMSEPDVICPWNDIPPGNVQLAQAGLRTYLGGRLTILPQISIWYLSFEPITEPRVLEAMEQHMHKMFPMVDTLLADFVNSCIENSYNNAIVQNTKVATMIVRHDTNLTVIQRNPSAEKYFGQSSNLTGIVCGAIPFHTELLSNTMDKFNEWFDIKALTINGLTLDCIMKAVPHADHTTCILIEDISDYVKRREDKAVFDAQKSKDAEHNQRMSHHHKNSYISLLSILDRVQEYVQKSDPVQLQVATNDMKQIAQHGVDLCLRTNALKAIQYGDYKPLSQWVNLSKLLSQWSSIVTMGIDDKILIEVDEVLLKIVIQNYISNALRYGDGECTVSTRFDNGSADKRVVISVVNKPHPEQLVQHAKKMEKYKSPLDCFQLGPIPQQGIRFSEGVGLHSVEQCCKTLGAQYGVAFKETFVEAFVSLPNISMVKTKTVFEDYPVIACVEDSSVNRKVLSRLLQKTNCNSASFVVGATINEIIQFPQKVLNHSEMVDVCIIDQNLDDPQGVQPTILGTDIVRQLQNQGFKGKCFIRSANDSPTDVAFYRSCGAMFMSKNSNDQAAFVQTIESSPAFHVEDRLVEREEEDVTEMRTRKNKQEFNKAMQM
jgi:hypothetical protein